MRDSRLVVRHSQSDGLGATAGSPSSAGNTVGQANRGTRQIRCVGLRVQPRPCRVASGSAGFTLIELLVVITIIGLLVGMTMPAITAARESARRASCMNNLKQMAMASHALEADLGYLPAGGDNGWVGAAFVNSTPAVGAEQAMGWPYQILPYMGETALWALTSNVKRMVVAPPFFFCPTRGQRLKTRPPLREAMACRGP